MEVVLQYIRRWPRPDTWIIRSKWSRYEILKLRRRSSQVWLCERLLWKQAMNLNLGRECWNSYWGTKNFGWYVSTMGTCTENMWGYSWGLLFHVDLSWHVLENLHSRCDWHSYQPIPFPELDSLVLHFSKTENSTKEQIIAPSINDLNTNLIYREDKELQSHSNTDEPIATQGQKQETHSSKSSPEVQRWICTIKNVRDDSCNHCPHQASSAFFR